jgi:hypothetical protein
MKVEYSRAVIEALESAPPSVRQAFFKQVTFLVQNLHHPSLHAKKFDESRDRWQARVNQNWQPCTEHRVAAITYSGVENVDLRRSAELPSRLRGGRCQGTPDCRHRDDAHRGCGVVPGDPPAAA